MVGRLSGSTALVTGSTRGIGRVIAETLAHEGADLILSGRDPADVARTVEELASPGRVVHGIAADLADASGAHGLAEQVLATTPRLDILVNNAGMSYHEPFWDISDERWEEQTNVNYRSPFILAQHAARHMRAKGIPGRIVNFSTIGARRCHADTVAYDAAKAAVETMTRNMAWELGPDGITVNCVAPGPIGDRPGARERPGLWEGIRPYVPVGRVGSGADVAEAVLFFCLPEASFVTGHTMHVDGGYGSGLPENYPRE
jgi:NAD(P)-dependent dehydrogenase (short-subunit alcohol dehydrogenase family)